MTGFGKANYQLADKTVQIEIRSLNSKQIDISVKIPVVLKEKELELRNLIADKLERGKIDFSMTFDTNGESAKFSVNAKLVRQYYNALKSVTEELKLDKCEDYLSIIMRMPDVLSAETEVLNETEWEKIRITVNESIIKLDKFRISEGEALSKELMMRTSNILGLLEQTEPFENKRMDDIKSRILRNINKIMDEIQFDKNRFEQELFYYIEKLDITEEKLRLKKHCDYFVETLNEDHSSGKKLSFITQEMGREINTLGSKANDVNIQQIVVRMKDELEKIKEQLSNVL